MNCIICKSKTVSAFNAVVLKKYTADYHVCPNCGYLFTHEPHWLSEAYANPITISDTGLVRRNISIAAKLASIFYFYEKDRGGLQYLDIAGGYGVLTRAMRDFGFDFYWKDDHCENILPPGFEYESQSRSCAIVTAIEVLEHVVDPVQFVRAAMEDVGAHTIILSTLLYDGAPPDPNEWWYYSFSNGQHIGFFQMKTLVMIAKKLEMNLVSVNKLHILTKNKINNINKISLDLLTKDTVSRLASYWIQYRLGSKTISDHNLLVDRS